MQLLVLPGSQLPSPPPLTPPRMPQLLVLVDATEADKPLLEISRQAMRSDFTLLLAWSPQVGRGRLASRHRPPRAAVLVPCATAVLRLTADGAPPPALHREQEAARYLETLKAYARKPADLIQGQNDRAFMTQLTEASSQ